MLINPGDLIPVIPAATAIPWSHRRSQILNMLHRGPVTFSTLVYDTNVGDISSLSTYFNPERISVAELNNRFGNHPNAKNKNREVSQPRLLLYPEHETTSQRTLEWIADQEVNRIWDENADQEALRAAVKEVNKTWMDDQEVHKTTMKPIGHHLVKEDLPMSRTAPAGLLGNALDNLWASSVVDQAWGDVKDIWRLSTPSASSSSVSNNNLEGTDQLKLGIDSRWVSWEKLSADVAW